jgi:hypothetical protein
LKHCSSCDRPLDKRKRRREPTGLCRGCNLKRWQHLSAGREFAEQRAERLREMLRDPRHRERLIAQRREASRKRMAWCPLEYRDTYRRLTRVKQLPAAEARAAILDLIAADARSYARTGELQQSRRAG